MSSLTSRIAGPRVADRLGPLDPREAAWRPDLADIALADRIAVPNYVKPVPHRLSAVRAPLHIAPDAAATAASELLHGEAFAVLEIQNGWAWGYGLHDHYVGYLRADTLGPDRPVSHRIGPGDALLFADPRVKAAVVGTLPMGAEIEAFEHDERFMRLLDGRFIHRRHLLPLTGHPRADWIGLAQSFLGAPYQWGGRSRAGVDCSGLLQVAAGLTGRPLRRDSDMQFADAATPLEQPERGAIAYWPGHIGVMLDATTLLHANAHWMTVVAEPLADVIARAAAGEGPAEPRFKHL
ncbi:C40 family peptidase [Sandaracinobacteroides saxicola]|uniref:C40 family peptidase n=1 Tax=Sandaracinobacteroides saxicola TaxID=2759707 RepID=A0A7G5IEE4_9SPHN|nr:NlpC/P60 family protein [Sandaracinobacteroides saxicola]QMW21736.1 C40 family peptidase [Sandaracinobacteroides saxicola]